MDPIEQVMALLIIVIPYLLVLTLGAWLADVALPYLQKKLRRRPWD